MNKVADPIVPKRLRNLVNRLARLDEGQAYTLTLFFPQGGEPIWTIQPLGKVENDRQPRTDVLK